MKKIVRPVILPVITAFIWGNAFVAQDLALAYVGPFFLCFLRSLVALVAISAFILIKDSIKNPDLGKSKCEIVRDRNHLLKAGIICGVFTALGSIFQQLGMSLGSEASKAGFITAMYVVLVPVLGVIFFRKKASVNVYFSVALSVIALYCLCVKQNLSFEPSDLVVLCCAVFYALQILFIDKFICMVDSLKLNAAQLAITMIISGILCFSLEEVPTWSQVKCVIWPVLFLAVFSSFIAFLLQLEAQKGTNPMIVTLILSLESVFATISGCILLKQHLTTKEVTGCIIMFIAVVLSQLPKPRRC